MIDTATGLTPGDIRESNKTVHVFAGFPEGVRIVRYGHPEPGEHCISFGAIKHASRCGCSEGFVVEPADGYEFEFNVLTQVFRAVKCAAVPLYSATVTLVARTPKDLIELKKAIKSIERFIEA